MFNRNLKEFLHPCVTINETWIHHYTPETKKQLKQWVEAGRSAPEQPKTQQSAGKVMTTLLWDVHGMIHIDYLEKEKTITAQYYRKLLDRFDATIKAKRPHLARKKIVFQQDNAPAHKAVETMTKLPALKYELLSCSPYSPDLAPCDYHLFRNFKRCLGAKRFYSDEEVIAETKAYFEELSANFY